MSAGPRGRRTDVSWPLAAGLLGLVILSVLVLVALGLALGWAAGKAA